MAQDYLSKFLSERLLFMCFPELITVHCIKVPQQYCVVDLLTFTFDKTVGSEKKGKGPIFNNLKYLSCQW
jgi:hypothetical protein